MSLVKSKQLEGNKSELEIFVEAETFQDACRRVYLREVKRLSVPGFRKGKAPKKVIEKRYGEGVFFDSAIDLVYPKAIDDAVTEAGLDVVSLETIEPIEVSEKNGFSFKAVFILKPDAKIENYKGIDVKCEAVVVDAKMVNDRLEELRQRSGRLVSVDDRAAKKDDFVLIDYEGFVDGKKFQGGSAKNFNLKLGSNQFIEGFEKQIIGHKVGDEFEVNVVFPENYHVENLKGKKAKFNCKLNEIKVLELKNLDDEFAKDVSKFDTLKELKDDIKEHLKKHLEESKKRRIDSQILEFLNKNVDVQIPQVMIDKKTDDLAKDFENRLSARGLTLDRYLSATRVSGYDLKDNFSEQAEFSIRTDLALEKIAKLEKIELQESDFEAERQKIAEIYGVAADKIKNIFSNERLKPGLIISKALDFVRSSAKISEIPAAKDDSTSKQNSGEDKAVSKSKKSDVKAATKSNVKKTTKAKPRTTKSTTSAKTTKSVKAKEGSRSTSSGKAESKKSASSKPKSKPKLKKTESK